jgi:hypothetical protein
LYVTSGSPVAGDHIDYICGEASGYVNDACFPDWVVQTGNPSDGYARGYFHYSFAGINYNYHSLHIEFKFYSTGTATCNYFVSGDLPGSWDHAACSGV